MNDTERLNWLEQKQGGAVISDDFGSWAFAADGMQNIPDDPPADTWTSFFITKAAWKPSIRAAIDDAIKRDS